MKLTKLCLFLVALFATVSLIGCGDPGVTNTPANNNNHQIDMKDDYINHNYDGPAVKEICYFDFESPVWQSRAFAPTGDGATVETKEGVGRNGSSAIYVVQQYNWGELLVDLKNAYSKGKAYYFEGWIKDADTPQEVFERSETASASITVWDNDIKTIAKANGGEYYDWSSSWDPSQPGPWDAAPTSEIPDAYYEKLLGSEFIEKDGEDILEFQCSLVDVSKDDWAKVCGLVRAEDIDSIVNAKAQDDLVGFSLVFFEGVYADDEAAGQNGYKYYFDDLRILDLNPEIYAGAGVYVEPPSVEYDVDENGVITVNLAVDNIVEISNKGSALYATFTLTGNLPEGVKFNTDEGYFEGEIDESFVEAGQTKEYPLTVAVKNKAGEATTSFTLKIINEEEE